MQKEQMHTAYVSKNKWIICVYLFFLLSLPA